jgi:uncharacterized iron-regulated membrane protein
VNLVLDAASGAVLRRTDFADRPLLDRVIGIGVAAHEGQLFGAWNQALGVFTTSGLVLVSTSAVVLWWRRRKPGVLGAPAGEARTPMAIGILLLMVALGIVLPLLGSSMLAVLLLERLVLRRLPMLRDFLGLPGPSRPTA